MKAYRSSNYQVKAGTLLESGQGAGLIPVPDVIPGVVTTLFQPLGVADVFAQSQTSSNSVRYVIEGTATNSVAGVAEGGLKPASDLALSTIDEPVKKLATTPVISDELLEDGPSVQGYLNGRLTLFTRLREETSLLRGAGTNDLVGIMDASRGINLYAKQAGDDNAVCPARVLANTAGSSYLTPDTIIMHPTNFLATRLLRDSTGGTIGGYLGTGPFGMSYGNQGAPGLFGQELWGTRVVLSTIVGAGTALVGSFQLGARIVRRGGRTIEITNSHSDYFIYNLAMIRAESRLGLCLFRPAAFTEVRGLS